jgi:hypothetical protein
MTSNDIPPEHIVASRDLVQKVGVEFLEHLEKFGQTSHIRGFCAYMLAIHRGEI